MSRQLIVSIDARADIAHAVEWLRERSLELQPRFEVELERIYASIVEHPELYPSVYRRFRRAVLRRFPYSVFYVLAPGAILVVGVVHQSRDESTWRSRS